MKKKTSTENEFFRMNFYRIFKVLELPLIHIFRTVEIADFTASSNQCKPKQLHCISFERSVLLDYFLFNRMIPCFSLRLNEIRFFLHCSFCQKLNNI